MLTLSWECVMSKSIDREPDYFVVGVEVKGGIKNALDSRKKRIEYVKEFKGADLWVRVVRRCSGTPRICSLRMLDLALWSTHFSGN